MLDLNISTKSFDYGAHRVTLETGRYARQADGAVMVRMGDTAVLVTVVGHREAGADQGFFPLTVNYQERTYAAGKVPGGFFKREGRPSEKETLVCRLIDRPLRPSFPKGFLNEVQIIATVMSLDSNVDADVPALLGASAAVAISGIPFNGTVAGARVGYIDGQYVLNPTFEQLSQSDLDLVVAGNEESVLMVESEAKLLTEEQMLGAVVHGHEHMQVAIKAIRELAEEARKPRWDWLSPPEDERLASDVESRCASELGQIYTVSDKIQRHQALDELRGKLTESIEAAAEQGKALKYFSSLERKIIRQQVLSGSSRMDGRDTRSVRPLSIEVGVLPRTHGSALFTRGETQALVTTTLGTNRDAQIIDAIEGESRDRFIFHYNFPPYCVGETGFMGSPKRREIGHGRLAKRSLLGVMPHEGEFPYVLRVVSEITESNGSSSMASVCGSSLAMMNAGVPLKASVAGVAMGLILEGDKYAVLTDILGDEDHLGDMDFKVAGTKEAITALQMDIKTNGVTPEIMKIALDQAKEARLHILEQMDAVIDKPGELSVYAPRLLTMMINPEKIRDVIGKGGSTIRALTEETGAVIDIDDSGKVVIAANDGKVAEEARRRIEELVADVEPGRVYEGKVAKVVDFGAFVTILPGRDGLVHISQIASDGRRLDTVDEVLSEGDIVKVKVLEIDRQGRVRLSMRGL